MRKITIRRAEPSDYRAVCAIYAAPLAQAGTLQLPMPAEALWQTRMQPVAPDLHMLVAEVDGEVVGQLGLQIAGNPRRRHVAEIGMGVRDRARHLLCFAA